MTRNALALAAAAATGVQVGAAIVATRWVVEQTTPISLAMLRYAIGFACLLPAALLMGRVTVERGDRLPIALLGIGQFGILIVLLNYGLQTIPSARAALIFATFPLMTLLVASALGHERMTVAKTCGVLLTLAGVAIVLSEPVSRTIGTTANVSAHPASASHWVGDAAVALSALVGALCSVLYRPYLRKYPALPMSVMAMLASVVFLAMLSLIEGSIAVPLHLSRSAWAAIAFIGVISGIGYFLWLFALRHASATRVTIFLSLSPVTAAVLGAMLLDEPVTRRLAAGLACVVAGLWLATRARTDEPARAPSL